MAPLTSAKALILPYYVQIFIMKPAVVASKIAEIAANTTAIIAGLLRVAYLYKAEWVLIGPWRSSLVKKSSCRKKRELEIYDSPELDLYHQMTSPVPLQGEGSKSLMKDLKKNQPQSSATGPSPPAEKSKQPAGTQFHAARAAVPAPPPAIVLTSSPFQRHANYSIFPTRASAMTRESCSTTFSQGDDVLEVPQPLFAFGHKRDLSGQTSATVEIGLRLSNMSQAVASPTCSASFVDSKLSIDNPQPPTSGKMMFQPEPSTDMPKALSILPIHPSQHRTLSQSLSPRSDLLSPNYLLRKGSTMKFPDARRDRNVMKSLPPVPPGEPGSLSGRR